MRLGVLTGGGDCPGLNAAIHAIVVSAVRKGDEVLGFHHGWRGVVHDEFTLLDRAAVRGIENRGGTILGTARYHPHEHEGALDGVVSTLGRHGIDTVLVLGGDGTLAASVRVAALGVRVIGIPKTIDNDVMGTSECIGHDTAVMIATEAIDRLHTTAESHDRLMVVEVMGRSAGWIAVRSGIAACADAIVIPEQPVKLEKITEALLDRHARGANFSIVVVAEGATLEEGVQDRPNTDQHASTGSILAGALRTSTGFETRLTVLGHVQRGGAPTAQDRLLATHFGTAAVTAAREGQFDIMVGGSADQVRIVPLTRVLDGVRTVSEELQRLASHITTV